MLLRQPQFWHGKGSTVQKLTPLPRQLYCLLVSELASCLMSSSRPRTRSKQGLAGGGGASSSRPVTRARQRGYYSEISGLHAAVSVGVS